MALQTNPQLELAFDYVSATNKNIFLTGKAGTGKTTFLDRVRNEVVKRIAVVAPTGVAAINAGGMTIHSFFQLPFGPFLPGNSRDASRQRKFAREKIRVIKGLDLLVIDEISMVRADLLDGIDEVLRRYKNPYQPFGGVQLLMIGDLHQLPPVVKDEEWHMLRPHYSTPYFFSSQALQQTAPVVIELKHIYRQSDRTFIELLNKVRNNRIDAEVLETLNSRFIEGFQPREEDAYITLSTHNATAQQINAQRLSATPGAVQRFRAKITGDFPAHAYPADEQLEVKIGAQVMFVKNDISRDKLFYNGKIGRITRIQQDTIYVRCPGENEDIEVGPMDWENIKYTLNEQTKEVTDQVLGTFTQIPLKLAWAITIHKSQGLTFERVILDAQAAFAHGQVYVALSRCKSFEGIVLRSRIIPTSVRTDPTVQNFSEKAEKNAPDEAQLRESKRAFQQNLLLELFSFSDLEKIMEKTRRVLLEHEKSLHPQAYTVYHNFQVEAENGVFPVADKFRRQIQSFFGQGDLPEDNEPLQERVRKACAWFVEKLETGLLPTAKSIQLLTDNKTVLKLAQEALDKLQQEVFVKHRCFAASQAAFVTQDYLRTKANAELDFQAVSNAPKPTNKYSEAPSDIEHPELFARLKKWRTDFAEIHQLEAYQVLFTKALISIVQNLPADLVSLRKIKGIGKVKSQQFGAELLAIIHEYCQERGIAITPLHLVEEPEKLPKPDTKLLSFELYKSGKTIDEIAAERGFVRSTIEGHLAHFVALGELDVFELIDEADLRKIEAFFKGQEALVSSEAKAHFGEEYSYGQIKLVLTWMNGEGD